MKLAMAQMEIGNHVADNLQKTIDFIKEAGKMADFVFFPELQLTPFYPLYHIEYWGGNREALALNLHSDEVRSIRRAAMENEIWVSPNLYIEESLFNSSYGTTQSYYRDMNLVISSQGEIIETASMVHVLGVENFWETEYYDPSNDGFKVIETSVGKIGVVICYDRHLPESIRTCTLKGAELVIIPTVNMKNEPMEMFMQELRVQAYQNNIFIAMCNRVGKQDKAEFAGESLVINPEGEVLVKADDKEQLIVCDIDLSEVCSVRAKRPYILTRRNDDNFYC